MLELLRRNCYRVKKGDSVERICREFSIPECVLVGINSLSGDVEEGQIIIIPENNHHLYTVTDGDSKKKLCGNDEKYREINFTDYFFIGMRIFI